MSKVTSKGTDAREVSFEFDHTKGRPGVWVGKDGREYPVNELEDSHLKSILNFFFGCTDLGRGVGPLRVMENAAYQINCRPVLLEVVAEGCRRRLIPGKYLSFLNMLKHEVMIQEGLSSQRGRTKRREVLSIRVGSEMPVRTRRMKKAA